MIGPHERFQVRMVLECHGALTPNAISTALAELDYRGGHYEWPQRIEAHPDDVAEWRALHPDQRPDAPGPGDVDCLVKAARGLEPGRWRIVYAAWGHPGE